MIETRKMINSHVGRLAGIRKRMLVVAVALMVPAATLGLASPALATEHHPKGAFAPFADCPLSNSSVTQCIVASTTSGEFTVGKKTVPINKTITLQGGTIENPETGELTFVGAEDGNTLSKTALTVPGGLLGIQAPKTWPKELQEKFNKFINEGLTGVTETTELAKPASAIKLSVQNLLFEEGVALQLPVKIKLSNPFLGSSCYVGSESNPIILNLTTGTTSPPAPNKPIKGSAGELKIEEEGALVVLTGGSLVDNAFAAPGATGCGGFFSFFVDPLVDSILGVPASAGHNTAILTGKLEQAAAAAVKASE
jgi:hypothetical protein